LLTEHGFVSYDDFRHRVAPASHRLGPPTDPERSGEPDEQRGASFTTDSGEASSILLAGVQARADELLAELNEEVERQLARIERRAAEGLAEILRQTTEGREALSALLAASARRPADLPTPLPVTEDIRRGTAALKRELGQLSRSDPTPSL
jgi:hypothetical protein